MDFLVGDNEIIYLQDNAVKQKEMWYFFLIKMCSFIRWQNYTVFWMEMKSLSKLIFEVHVLLT
jgi:hypothetical protein